MTGAHVSGAGLSEHTRSRGVRLQQGVDVAFQQTAVNTWFNSPCLLMGLCPCGRSLACHISVLHAPHPCFSFPASQDLLWHACSWGREGYREKDRKTLHLLVHSSDACSQTKAWNSIWMSRVGSWNPVPGACGAAVSWGQESNQLPRWLNKLV